MQPNFAAGSSMRRCFSVHAHWHWRLQRLTLPAHRRQHPSAMNLWVDCDGGIDDIHAVMLAVRLAPVPVEGVSIVHGNIAVEQGLSNVARALVAAGLSDSNHAPPVFAGADAPLLAPRGRQSNWFGSDGLGDVPELAPSAHEARQAVSPAHGIAAVKLVEAAQRLQGQGRLAVVALGPLTNIALALKLEPNLPSLVSGLFILGGGENGGNVTPAAEFNFYQDPEAAALVMRSFSIQTRVITWQACESNLLPWAFIERLKELKTSRAEFALGIMAPYLSKWRQSSPRGLNVGDVLAVAAALRGEQVIRREVQARCSVELTGTLTRGMSVFERLRTCDEECDTGGPGQVNLVVDMDVDMVEAMLLEALS